MNDAETALLFARLLCDVMIPSDQSAGYIIVEAHTLPTETQRDD